jgi:hypothetical protein
VVVLLVSGQPHVAQGGASENRAFGSGKKIQDWRNKREKGEAKTPSETQEREFYEEELW